MTPGTDAFRCLIVGLCIAAAAAIAALVAGEMTEVHWNVVWSSLGFSLFLTLGVSGNALSRTRQKVAAALGTATAAVAVLAFCLFLTGLWGLADDETLWQATEVLALFALWGSHGSVVLRAQRSGDPPSVTALVWISVITSGFVVVVADIALLEVVDEVGDGFVRAVAIALVVSLLSTALPPLLRRTAGVARARPDAPASIEGLTLIFLAGELEGAADRLDAAGTADDGRREAETLRRLATRARRVGSGP